MTRGWPPGIGVLLATTITAAAGYYLAIGDQPRAQGPRTANASSDDARLASRSPAYLFGFANAALAGCDFQPGAGLDQLAAAVDPGEQGVVPDEIKAGFADFQGLLRARGSTSACAMAERVLGPHAPARAGVLSPR